MPESSFSECASLRILLVMHPGWVHGSETERFEVQVSGGPRWNWI